MTSKLTLLGAGILLAAATAGYGQPTLQFSAATYTAAENAGAVTLSVRRLNDANAAVTVDYATANGTATAGLDYTAIVGTLAFDAGEIYQTLTVPILNDSLAEALETFTVVLSNPTGGAVLGTPATASVRITDNDGGLQFTLSTCSVIEDAGAVVLGVGRGDDGTLAATVTVATSDVTATNGLDYTGITNTISFGPTERLKLVTVPILNDSLKEANKTFRATLSDPVGATLGIQKTTTITIVDNDQGFQFESVDYDGLDPGQ